MNNFEVKRTSDHFFQIALHIFHHHIESGKGSRVFWFKNFDDFNDLRMLEFSQERDFTQYALAVYFIFKNILHALDCDLLACRLLKSPTHASVTSNADNFLYFVVRSNFPIRKLCILLTLGKCGDLMTLLHCVG